MTQTALPANQRLAIIDDVVAAAELACETDGPLLWYMVRNWTDDTWRTVIDAAGATQPDLPLLDAAKSRVRQAAAVAALRAARPATGNVFADLNRLVAR